MNKTSIEWTHRPETRGADGGRTWNPIRARLKGLSGQIYKSHVGTFCTRISPGCTNCYASVVNKRFGNGLEYTVPNLENVEFFLSEKILQEPLKTKKPCTIFVGDMFDLFHEAIPAEFVDAVIAVALLCPQHVFQLLTKRADWMHGYFSSSDATWLDEKTGRRYAAQRKDDIISAALNLASDKEVMDHQDIWPLPNVWLGVSVESQKYADERIPLLLQTPAAVRFLSVEPQLEAVDLTKISTDTGVINSLWKGGFRSGRIDWVICGGESGPHARQFDPAWAAKLFVQCRKSNTAFFMKQFGSNCYFREHDAPVDPKKYSLETPLLRDRAAIALGSELNHWHKLKFKDRKGGDPSEWPESLRVREFPG